MKTRVFRVVMPFKVVPAKPWRTRQLYTNEERGIAIQVSYDTVLALVTMDPPMWADEHCAIIKKNVRRWFGFLTPDGQLGYMYPTDAEYFEPIECDDADRREWEAVIRKSKDR